MSVVFVPIPPGKEGDYFHKWITFIEKISDRTGETVNQLLEVIDSGEVSIGLAYYAESKEALAMIGYRIRPRGDDRVAEVCWLIGEDKEVWLPLMPIVEQYMREHQGCAALRAIARPGWKRVMEKHGYAMSHVVIEKELA